MRRRRRAARHRLQRDVHLRARRRLHRSPVVHRRRRLVPGRRRHPRRLDRGAAHAPDRRVVSPGSASPVRRSGTPSGSSRRLGVVAVLRRGRRPRDRAGQSSRSRPRTSGEAPAPPGPGRRGREYALQRAADLSIAAWRRAHHRDRLPHRDRRDVRRALLSAAYLLTRQARRRTRSRSRSPRALQRTRPAPQEPRLRPAAGRADPLHDRLGVGRHRLPPARPRSHAFAREGGHRRLRAPLAVGRLRLRRGRRRRPRAPQAADDRFGRTARRLAASLVVALALHRAPSPRSCSSRSWREACSCLQCRGVRSAPLGRSRVAATACRGRRAGPASRPSTCRAAARRRPLRAGTHGPVSRRHDRSGLLGLVARGHPHPFQEQRDPDEAPLRAQLAEGFSWLWRHRFLRTSALLFTWQNLIFEALFLTLVVVARRQGLTRRRSEGCRGLRRVLTRRFVRGAAFATAVLDARHHRRLVLALARVGCFRGSAERLRPAGRRAADVRLRADAELRGHRLSHRRRSRPADRAGERRRARDGFARRFARTARRGAAARLDLRARDGRRPRRDRPRARGHRDDESPIRNAPSLASSTSNLPMSEASPAAVG